MMEVLNLESHQMKGAETESQHLPMKSAEVEKEAISASKEVSAPQVPEIVNHNLPVATKEAKKEATLAPKEANVAHVLVVKEESRDDDDQKNERKSSEERDSTTSEARSRENSRQKPSPSRKIKPLKSPQRMYMPNPYPPSYPQANRGRYPHHHGMHGPPSSGPYGPPQPYYGGGPHEFRGPPQFHHMPPLPHPSQYGPGGHYGHPPNMAGRPGTFPHPAYGSYPTGPPMGYPGGHPHHHHHHQGYPPHMNVSHSVSIASDSNSISSSKSKGSRGSKKRTIDRVHNGNEPHHDYSFRRTNSNASSNSTVTHDNHTTDTHPLKRDPNERKCQTGPDNIFDQERFSHRRHHSGASTTSSLSAGGFSLHSYEGPKADGVMNDIPKMAKASPKRRKGGHNDPLVIDTGLDTKSIDGAESRFEKLSMNDKDKAREENNGNSLFLSLSTSPINHPEVDATPLSKNVKRKESAKITIKTDIMEEDEEEDANEGNVPSPFRKPMPTPKGTENDIMNDEQLLNKHLRGQTFTPLHHLEQAGVSPSNGAFGTINQTLSWSIAGDTPSLEDLAACSWEEHEKGDSTKRPDSTTSHGSSSTRDMVISPHNFSLWKEEHENKKCGEEGKDNDTVRLSMLSPHSEIAMAMEGESGTTTPLPIFFNDKPGSEERENFNHDKRLDMFGQRGSAMKQHYHSAQYGHAPPTPVYGKPPTPHFTGSNPGFARSPMHGDGRVMFGHPPHAHNDRVRNLRGRMPGHMPPMPLHISPHLSSHHPLTSPIGIGGQHGKPMWSPHHRMPPMASPPHGMSPMDLTQSKRKCVPLKPPIPTKFQGDVEKFKGANVPEFTTLVNFPAHMSQKQSVNLPEGMRCCVMCGQACPCSSSNKSKKSGKGKNELAPRNNNGHDMMGDKSNFAIIPTQNKGLCTMCDVNVWVVCTTGLEIKWCKGCKNFRPWASFGDKGLATKCLRCRERQREKYALQKEEKEKARLTKGSKING